MATTSEVVTAMFKLRSKIEAAKQRHKEELKTFEEPLAAFETFMLSQLQGEGEQSRNVEGVGTVYKRRMVSVSVADWEATWEWIRKHDRYDVLNHAVNKTVVEAIVEETQTPPPGVNYAVTMGIGYNRARTST